MDAENQERPATPKFNEQLFESLTQFHMRSCGREVQADRKRLETVITAIDEARKSADAERSGLVGRIKSMLSRAERIPCGKGIGSSKRRLDALSRELAHAEIRLTDLSAQIAHLDQIRKLVNAVSTSRE